MDAVGINTILPALPTQVSQAPILPRPSADTAPAIPTTGGQMQDPVAAVDQKRYQAVQQLAQNVANLYVVSDQSFTIFKDATGQYITRFISLRDGKVTYVPEPSLIKMSHSDPSMGLNIKA